MRRIEPYFPLSHAVARVDDRRVISGIFFVIRNGLRWRDAPPGYGPHKTISNRFVRWSRLGRGRLELGKSTAEVRHKAIRAKTQSLASHSKTQWGASVLISCWGRHGLSA